MFAESLKPRLELAGGHLRWAARATRSRIALGILALGTVFFCAASALDLRVNWSESMPRGVYRRIEPALERGTWVAVCLEGRTADLARERGYLIDGSCASGLASIFERIVGVPGDRIDLAMRGVAVNGAAVPNSESSARDSRGRPLEHTPEGTMLLADGRFFVMGMNPGRSWDSRSFGVVSAHQIVAAAAPTRAGPGRAPTRFGNSHTDTRRAHRAARPWYRGSAHA